MHLKYVPSHGKPTVDLCRKKGTQCLRIRDGQRVKVGGQEVDVGSPITPLSQSSLLRQVDADDSLGRQFLHDGLGRRRPRGENLVFGHEQMSWDHHERIPRLDMQGESIISAHVQGGPNHIYLDTLYHS
jgi:hypothetical protein